MMHPHERTRRAQKHMAPMLCSRSLELCTNATYQRPHTSLYAVCNLMLTMETGFSTIQ